MTSGFVRVCVVANLANVDRFVSMNTNMFFFQKVYFVEISIKKKFEITLNF